MQAAAETESAIAIFERALSLDPDSMAAKINLATALMDQLEVNRAIEIFEGIVDGVALGDELPEHALRTKISAYRCCSKVNMKPVSGIMRGDGRRRISRRARPRFRYGAART